MDTEYNEHPFEVLIEEGEGYATAMLLGTTPSKAVVEIDGEAVMVDPRKLRVRFTDLLGEALENLFLPDAYIGQAQIAVMDAMEDIGMRNDYMKPPPFAYYSTTLRFLMATLRTSRISDDGIEVDQMDMHGEMLTLLGKCVDCLETFAIRGEQFAIFSN